MNCSDAQPNLPGYLDDSISASERTRLREHLYSCADCREELRSYSLLARHLAHVEPIRPPANLALRIQGQASRRRLPWATLTRAWNRVLLISQNILEPLAVPATGGVLTAVGVFLLVVQSMLGGMPAGGVYTDDLPLNLVQPASSKASRRFRYPESDWQTARQPLEICCLRRRLTRKVGWFFTRSCRVLAMPRYSIRSIKFFCFRGSVRS